MLTTYMVLQGFGPRGVKEYFAVQRDGDTLGGIVAGPFEDRAQCLDAIDALKPLYLRNLYCVAGHLAPCSTLSAALAQE